MTNGYDLYTLNADTPSLYPGSTVKTMTMLLLREYHAADWSSTVMIVTADVTQPAGLNISMAGLQAGDVISWEGLAYAMMLPSGGDAALAIARLIGTELYVAAGNTGATGVARFVERMNARASELGMTNTTYVDPFGGSKTFDPDVTRNILSPRDLSAVAWQCFSDMVAQAICGSASYGISITGTNARTLNVSNGVGLLNGPTLVPAGISDDNVYSAKGGAWVYVAGSHNIHMYSITSLWKSPNGTEVIITTIGSESNFASMLDQRGLMFGILRDFPYLYDGVDVGDDAFWDDVKLLVSGALADDSPVGRTVTTANVVAGDPLVADSSGGIVFDGASDDVHVTDGADISVTSGDMTVEMFYAADGNVPGTGVEYVFAIKTALNNLEWAANYYNGGFNIFASANGTSWSSVVALNMDAVDRPVFFNGAVRKIDIVKYGSDWRMFICGERMSPTISVGTVYDGNGDLSVGRAGVAPRGIIDEFRFTRVARYTAQMVTVNPRKFPRT